MYLLNKKITEGPAAHEEASGTLSGPGI